MNFMRKLLLILFTVLSLQVAAQEKSLELISPNGSIKTGVSVKLIPFASQAIFFSPEGSMNL